MIGLIYNDLIGPIKVDKDKEVSNGLYMLPNKRVGADGFGMLHAPSLKGPTLLNKGRGLRISQ